MYTIFEHHLHIHGQDARHQDLQRSQEWQSGEKTDNKNEAKMIDTSETNKDYHLRFRFMERDGEMKRYSIHTKSRTEKYSRSHFTPIFPSSPPHLDSCIFIFRTLTSN